LVTLKVSLKKFFQPVARKPYFIDDDAQFIWQNVSAVAIFISLTIGCYFLFLGVLLSPLVQLMFTLLQTGSQFHEQSQPGPHFMGKIAYHFNSSLCLIN
jgi:hypothetical protein